MAHIEKYQASAIGRMCGHYERRPEVEHGYRRENIDPERTHLNYNLGPQRPASQIDFINSRINSLNLKRRVRKDAVKMCDCVLTMPQSLDPRREREFFEVAYSFLAQRYGHENVVSAWVHKDESTPHMHFAWVPVTKDGRLSAKSVVTRLDLKTLHPDMQVAMETALGCRVEVLLDPEKAGEKQLSRLGQKDYIAAKRELERLGREVDAASNRLESVQSEERDAVERNIELGGEASGLVGECQRLEQQAGQLEEEAGRSERDAAELERAIAAERDRIDLENQVVEFFKGCRDSRDAFERIERLKKEVEEGEREAERSELKAANLERRAERAAEQVAELRGRVEGLEAERNGLVMSIERLGDRIADAARRVTDKIKALFARDETPAKVRQYAGSALSCLPDEQKAEVEAARAASAARVAEARRRLAPALEAYRVDVRAYRREFAAVAKSAAGTDYSEFPRPRVPVPDDELAKYEPLAADAYIAAKTACDRLVDKYAVNLPDGGDLNDGSTGASAVSPAQQTHVQDRSIERSVGVRDR